MLLTPLQALKSSTMERLAVLLSLLLMVNACSVNPVTGERELSLISESEEIQLGQKNYTPTVQSQGGRYYLEPDLSDYVTSVTMKVAKQSDRPDLPYEVVIINSNVPNAWALPGGKMAINRGLLLEMENEAQLAAVMGHEVVHAAARHSAQRMQKGMLVNIGLAGVGAVLAARDNPYAPLIVGGAAIGAQMALARYSREHELESDQYGTRYMAEAGYNPQQAAELQRIFLRLSEGREDNFVTSLFQTHPPSRERVEANEQLAAELGRDGRVGEEKYQRMIAGIREKQPAYDLYETALKQHREKQGDQALSTINQAIEKVPQEAAFLALRGDIRQQKGESKAALSDYDRAVNLYPEMFSYTLGRGLVHRSLNNWPEAEADFKRSIESVPTSIAYLGLGDAAKAQGRRDEAREYYQVAAQAEGEVGEAARRRLQELGD
ncbi:MAG: M48 family metalloprotease [Oleiphilaceae bacterium]|nr:M48 family metalloprotease [Oleiphilaceae bacterium]